MCKQRYLHDLLAGFVVSLNICCLYSVFGVVLGTFWADFLDKITLLKVAPYSSLAGLLPNGTLLPHGLVVERPERLLAHARTVTRFSGWHFTVQYHT